MVTRMVSVIHYAAPGPLTNLHGVDSAVLESIAQHPVDACFPVHALVIQPNEAQTIGMPAERLAENQLRPAARIVQALLALDPAPLNVPRAPEKRVIGTCRHFAVLSCALLRYRGIAARVRCGFATYFQPGQGVDHWITEYWDEGSGRWVRIDSEVLGDTVLPHPEDLRPGFDFLHDDGSLLSNGSLGWIQIANFAVTGLMVIACAVGIHVSRTVSASSSPVDTGGNRMQVRARIEQHGKTATGIRVLPEVAEGLGADSGGHETSR